mmetsp:Transcript_30057/g.77981  ORF Transcript_30057/g.77981 Transcript_30057/m.77981 type:complete len:120 (+) Transcript_30057:71-430(+)
MSLMCRNSRMSDLRPRSVHNEHSTVPTYIARNQSKSNTPLKSNETAQWTGCTARCIARQLPKPVSISPPLISRAHMLRANSRAYLHANTLHTDDDIQQTAAHTPNEGKSSRLLTHQNLR